MRQDEVFAANMHVCKRSKSIRFTFYRTTIRLGNFQWNGYGNCLFPVFNQISLMSLEDGGGIDFETGTYQRDLFSLRIVNLLRQPLPDRFASLSVRGVRVLVMR